MADCYNAQGVYEDQLDSVRKASSPAFHEIDLSLIADGLRAERKRVITIDVAYRYFSINKEVHHRRYALRINPDYSEPHYALANALRAKGDAEGAIAEYKRAVEFHPANRQASHRRTELERIVRDHARSQHTKP